MMLFIFCLISSAFARTPLKEPVSVTANSISVEKGIVSAEGNAKAVSGDLNLSANKLLLTEEKEKEKKLSAIGNITLVFHETKATNAERCTFYVKDQIVKCTRCKKRPLIIEREGNTVTGDILVINLTTKKVDLSGKRTSAIITPESFKKTNILKKKKLS